MSCLQQAHPVSYWQDAQIVESRRYSASETLPVEIMSALPATDCLCWWCRLKAWIRSAARDKNVKDALGIFLKHQLWEKQHPGELWDAPKR
jgi:hypothetical protein